MISLEIEELEKEIKQARTKLTNLKAKKRYIYKKNIKDEIRAITLNICDAIELDPQKAFFSRHKISSRYLRHNREISDKKFVIFYQLHKIHDFKVSYIAEALNHNHSNIVYHMKNAEITKNYPEVLELLNKID